MLFQWSWSNRNKFMLFGTMVHLFASFEDFNFHQKIVNSFHLLLNWFYYVIVSNILGKSTLLHRGRESGGSCAPSVQKDWRLKKDFGNCYLIIVDITSIFVEKFENRRISRFFNLSFFLLLCTLFKAENPKKHLHFGGQGPRRIKKIQIWSWVRRLEKPMLNQHNHRPNSGFLWLGCTRATSDCDE